MPEIYINQNKVHVNLDVSDIKKLKKKTKFITGDVISKDNGNRVIAKYYLGSSEYKREKLGDFLLDIEPNPFFEESGLLFLGFSKKGLSTLESLGGFNVEFENRCFYVNYKSNNQLQ